MPTVRRAQTTQRAPINVPQTPSATSAIPPSRGGEVGSALQQLGRTLFERQVELELEQGQSRARAISEEVRSEIAADTRIPLDQKPEALRERLSQRLDREVLEETSNPIAKRQLRTALSAQRDIAVARERRRIFQEQQEELLAATEANVDISVRNAAQSPDPRVHKQALRNIESGYQRLVDRQILTSEEADLRLREARSRATRQRAANLAATGSPVEAARAIRESNVPGPDKLALIRQLRQSKRARDRFAAFETREQRRQERRSQQDRALQLAREADPSQPDAVHERAIAAFEAGEIAPSGFDLILNMTEAKAQAEEEQFTIIDERRAIEAAGEGNVEEVVRLTRQAPRSKAINLYREAKESSEGGILNREDIQAAEEFLKDEMDPQSTYFMQEEEAVQRSNQARSTFRRIMRNNPDRDPDRVARRVIALFRPDPSQVPDPVFVSRPETKEEVQTAATRLRALLSSGDITWEQAAQDTSILKELRKRLVQGEGVGERDRSDALSELEAMEPAEPDAEAESAPAPPRLPSPPPTDIPNMRPEDFDALYGEETR